MGSGPGHLTGSSGKGPSKAGLGQGGGFSVASLYSGWEDRAVGRVGPVRSLADSAGIAAILVVFFVKTWDAWLRLQEK